MSKRKNRKLGVEILEARDMPATFAVMNIEGSGPGSLRAAITSANNNTGMDEVIFEATVFSKHQYILLQDEIAITDSVRITGSGADLLDLTGSNWNQQSRILSIAKAGAKIDVTVSRLSIQHGVSYGFSGGTGGGIYIADENVTLDSVWLHDNYSADVGGAVGSDGAASLTVLNSTFSSNHAYDDGGAIYLPSLSTLTIRNSTFQSNGSGYRGSR